MQSQHFDALTRSAAKISRRDLLRWCGVTSFTLLASKLSTRLAIAKTNGDLPPPYEPWSPENPPPGFDELIDDYLDCIVKLAREEQITVDPNKFEQCDRGFPGFDWCQIVWDVLTEAIPNLAGFASTFTPFSRNCGDRDCFQCCYTPSSGGCHSSFIGFPVINCNPKTYGEGTKPAGLTFIIDPSKVKPEDSCLFIPQVCSHIALCVGGSGAQPNAVDGFTLAPAADNYLTDARAIDQRARVFAMQAQDALRAYVENYATDTTDARPIQTLLEALLGRGNAGWRSNLRDHPIDITHAALRINDASGNIIPSATWANAAGLMALARLLGGVPNLFARLASVESKVWSVSDKSAYLAQVGDADAVLQKNLDAHFIAALKDIDMLQDAQLLAVPLAGESVSEGIYGGLTLGKAPVIQLDAAVNLAQVSLSLTLDDVEDALAKVDRAIAVDWGDGQMTHLTLATGQRQVTSNHSYAKAGRYAIYAVAAGDSGLRGYAALVVETTASAALRAVAAMPAIAQLRLDALSINFLGFTKRCALTARLAGEDGIFWPAGRTVQANGPTNIIVPVAMGNLFIHNPARYTVTRLRLEPRIDMAVPSSSSRVPNVEFNALTLGIFSTAAQSFIEKTIALTSSQLKLYLPNATTSLPENVIVVGTNGTLQVPLFWRATTSDPWQTIDRIEIDLTSDMLSGIDVNATPLPLAPGIRGTWAEIRPSEIQSVQFRQFMPRLDA